MNTRSRCALANLRPALQSRQGDSLVEVDGNPVDAESLKRVGELIAGPVSLPPPLPLSFPLVISPCHFPLSFPL